MIHLANQSGDLTHVLGVTTTAITIFFLLGNRVVEAFEMPVDNDLWTYGRTEDPRLHHPGFTSSDVRARMTS